MIDHGAVVQHYNSAVVGRRRRLLDDEQEYTTPQPEKRQARGDQHTPEYACSKWQAIEGLLRTTSFSSALCVWIVAKRPALRSEGRR
jgi:hypothetical protein